MFGKIFIGSVSVQFLRQDMDGIKKEHSLASAECHAIDKEINILNSAIDELRELYDKANAAQQDAFAALRELKKQESSKVICNLIQHGDTGWLFIKFCCCLHCIWFVLRMMLDLHNSLIDYV